MSLSSWEDVSTTTGIILSFSSDLICCSTSNPSTFGNLRSSSRTAGLSGIRSARREVSPAIQIMQGLFAITRDNNLVGKLIFLQSCQGQFHVFWVVLNHQNTP